jgi:hydrogenase maturation protease
MPAIARISVIGMGNVLMSDDAAGPYVIELLDACYEFGPGITVLDLGTPGLDLTPYIAGVDTLILVDTIRGDGTPGEIRRYEKPALMSPAFRPRVSPHDPALKEALTIAELAGMGPREVLLIGITPEYCAKGTGLSPTVRRAVEAATGAVIAELSARGASFRLRPQARKPDIWWEAAP